MPSLISQSFFVRDLNLPNPAATAEKVDSFIGRYEPKCLREIMGYPLYNIYLTEIQVPTPRMTDLKNGKDYTAKNGLVRKWLGLVHDTDVSLIANYVYYYIQEVSSVQTTGVGTSTQKVENGVAVSAYWKMVEAWNFYSEEVREMCNFLISLPSVYPEFTYEQYIETLRISRPIHFDI